MQWPWLFKERSGGGVAGADPRMGGSGGPQGRSEGGLPPFVFPGLPAAVVSGSLIFRPACFLAFSVSGVGKNQGLDNAQDIVLLFLAQR